MNSLYQKVAYEIIIVIIKMVLFISQLSIRSIFYILKFLYLQVVKLLQILITKYQDFCFRQKEEDIIAEKHIDKKLKQLQNRHKNSNIINFPVIFLELNLNYVFKRS